MFSLIIVLISVVLVIALVLATIYYLGDSSRGALDKSAASTIVNQATQIAAAGTTAAAHGVGWPAGSLTFDARYLANMPVPPKRAYVSGTPSAADWVYYTGEPTHIALRGKLTKGTCMALNRLQGFIGIPSSWTGKGIQCFGYANEGEGYTFLFEPSGGTAASRDASMAQSLTEATAKVPTAISGGFPVLCPDGSSIMTGSCPDTQVVAGGGGAGGGGEGGGGTGTPGFWVVQASLSQLTNHGFQATCPVGAIDPTVNPTPIPGQDADALNVDGIMFSEFYYYDGYTLRNDYQPAYTLTDQSRTWCIPALDTEVLPQANLEGFDASQTLVASLPTPGPTGITVQNEYSDGRVATITAKGQAWTIAAYNAQIIYAVGATTAHNNLQKFVIGRGSGVTETTYKSTIPLELGDFNGMTTMQGKWTGLRQHTPIVPIELTFSPWYYEFTNSVGSPEQITATLTNISRDATITISGIVISDYSGNDGFSQTNNCNQPIPPNGTCTFQITHAPTVPGMYGGNLRVILDNTGEDYSVNLQANVPFPEPPPEP